LRIGEIKVDNKSDELSERFLDYAVTIIHFIERLKDSFVGRYISGQLFRAGSSAGSNYEEARAAESRADFIHTKTGEPNNIIFIPAFAGTSCAFFILQFR
jgi:hypothetical protein